MTPAAVTDQRVRTVADLIVAVLAGISAGAVFGGSATGGFRPVVLLVTTVGLGWAAVGWTRLGDGGLTVALTASSGVSILLLGALLEVSVKWWHPVGSIGGLSVAVAAITLFRVERRLLGGQRL
jgi:hypothetical protein